MSDIIIGKYIFQDWIQASKVEWKKRIINTELQHKMSYYPTYLYLEQEQKKKRFNFIYEHIDYILNELNIEWPNYLFNPIKIQNIHLIMTSIDDFLLKMSKLQAFL